jgi:hypothetical protein
MNAPTLVLLVVAASATVACSAQGTDAPIGSGEPCVAQVAAPVEAGGSMSEYAARRENEFAPANAAFRCHDTEKALTLAKQALNDFPDDARALEMTGNFALFAGHPEQAVSLYRAVLAQMSHPPMARHCSWSTRSGLMNALMKLDQWEEFETERLATRRASLAGDPCLPSAGYPIDTLNIGREYIRTLEFPTLQGEDKVRDSFQLYEEVDPCTHFMPSVILEERQGGREFALLYHPSPGVSFELKRYFGGEPNYKLVRADVLAAMKAPQDNVDGSPNLRPLNFCR